MGKEYQFDLQRIVKDLHDSGKRSGEKLASEQILAAMLFSSCAIAERLEFIGEELAKANVDRRGRP